jgi:competence protein ComEC
MYGYMFLVLICTSILFLYRIVFLEKKPFTTFFILLIFGVFLSSYLIEKINYQKNIYESGFILKERKITGVISEFPSYRFSNNQYVISLDNQKTKVLIYTQPYQKFLYGEHIELSGSLKEVREEGEEWQRYYQDIGVQYVSLYPSISKHEVVLQKTFLGKIKQTLFIFKMYIRSVVLEKFSSHTSALILGMLLGERDELSKDEKDLFNQAGISHILVVSGYNISLVISLFFILFKHAPRYMRVILSMGAVVLFVLLVGADDSVVRAALKGSIIILAQLFHQKSSAVHTLFLAGLIMLLIKPSSLFDIGFHLSFLATFAILTIPNFKKVPEYVSTILWIFIYMSLYTTFLSERISFAGIISNMLMLFIIPFFMLLTSVSIVFSITKIQVLVDHFILEILSRYIFGVVDFVKILPFIEYKISPHIVAVIYVFILSFVLFFQNRYTTKEFIEKHYQKFVPQKSN